MSLRDQDIAVIGMAGRFPGASNVDALLALLRDGREGLTHFSREELIAAGVDPDVVDQPAYVRTNGILDEPARFDATFFGYTPREAELLDVQQRVFLEIAWTAIEHAGYHPRDLPGPCGVFAGSGLNTYLLNQLAANPEVVESAGGFSVMIANDKDHLATRAAYKLNLRGPTISVQTACSTSLVAVHLATQSLLAGECDVALAGGASIRVPQTRGYLHQEGMILSPDGHCRAFDAAAAGTVGGNGAGAVLLKRAKDAIADGDTLHAIIRGSAINNDGSAKVGYTAPSLDGQSAVIAEAQAVAEVHAHEIGYIEAHGTGTPLGDPIEVAALTQAFRRDTAENEFCDLGSVKTNLGHLDAAAGIAGFIKTVLSLREKTIFPTLHLQTPSPQINFPNTPFRVATALRPWTTTTGQPRRAGVSSFGIGGTNAHVVLEEPPASAHQPPANTASPQLFVVSAQHATGRTQLTRQLMGHDFASSPTDVAFTLATGRQAFSHRAALIGTDAQKLQTVAQDEVLSERSIAFIFPGQGCQLPGMASALYAQDADFRTIIDQGASTLQLHLEGQDLRPLLLARAGDPEAAAQLQNTALTQPALWLVCYALAQRWLKLGIEPAAMLGHSVGEWVAATLAGVFSMEEALRLIALRGRLMAAQPTGAMAAIGQDEPTVLTTLPAGLEIAAVNAPTQTVVSGNADAVDAYVAKLSAAGITAVRLNTSHAFHSASMQPAADALAEAIAQISLQPPTRRWISNVSGDWIAPAEATSAAYWAQQLRSPVRFADGLATLLAEGPCVLVEVGPGQTAIGLARRQPAWSNAHRSLASLPHPVTDTSLLPAVGALWCAGGTINWSIHFASAPRRRVPVPTYPFSGDTYWVEAATPARDTIKPSGPAQWLHLPSWSRSAAPMPTAPIDIGSWTLLGGPPAWREALTHYLSARNGTVIDSVEALQTARWVIDLRGLERDTAPTDGFLALQATAQTLARRATVEDSRLIVVTTGLASLAEEQAIDPAQSLLLGPVRVLNREVAGLESRLVDLPSERPQAHLVEALVGEALSPDQATVVLWRQGRRWVEAVASVPAPSPTVRRPHGPTLVTGGLGGIGGTIVADLAQRGDAQLVLIGRTPVNPEIEARLVALRAAGAHVNYQVADVSDTAALISLRDHLSASGVRISRIIHTAGQPASGTLLRTRADQSRTVLAAKVDGTRALWDVFGEQLSDGFLLMSSLSARLGEFGQSDYAAANAFMDAFASAHHTAARPVISLAWDAWADVGMAARLGKQPSLAAWHQTRRPWLISPADGIAALHLAESIDEPHVLIATHPLEGREVAPPKTVVSPSTAPVRHERPDLSNAFVAPQTPPESKIAEIWGELLGIKAIGRNDNFFDLGGHSLLATQVIARLRDDGSQAISLAEFFEYPSVAELANLLEQAAPANALPAPVPVARPNGRAPLSFAQQSLWLLDRMQGSSAHYNEFGAQQLRGPIDPDRITAALREVMARHEVLRTGFVEEDGSPVQKIYAATELPFNLPLLDWSDRTATEIETALTQLARELTAEPFDLTFPPLLRGRLIRRGADDHVLVMVVHHIVFDGWSARNFFHDMLVAYTSETSPLLPLQYADFAHWQRNTLVGDYRQSLEAFWREQFSPLPKPLAWPQDRPRPPEQTFVGRRHPVSLDAELTAKIEQLGRQLKASPFMVLLAGFAVVLGRHAAQEEVVIGSPVAGREHEQLEPLIGFFVNPLPLRIDLRRDPTFAALVKATRQRVLQAYAHQALPFESMVEAVAPPRDPSRHALFQSMLIFQNETSEPTTPDGITLTPWEPSEGPARSDLDLYLWQTSETLTGYFLYNIELFNPDTIERFTRRLLIFLSDAVARSDQPLSCLKMEQNFSLPGLGSRHRRPSES
ncbi:MAG: SDR family NAD(P)-dependent oxidoreductase [bacterium]